MSRKILRCLPGGEYTTDIKRYVRGWTAAPKKLCKLIPGLRLRGVNPGVSFYYGKHADVVNMPYDLVIKLLDAMEL